MDRVSVGRFAERRRTRRASEKMAQASRGKGKGVSAGAVRSFLWRRSFPRSGGQRTHSSLCFPRNVQNPCAAFVRIVRCDDRQLCRVVLSDLLGGCGASRPVANPGEPESRGGSGHQRSRADQAGSFLIGAHGEVFDDAV